MLDYENDDIELDQKNNEKLQRKFALEQQEETELAIEQDEHPIEPETDELPEKKKLKRELKAEALLRLETAAEQKRSLIMSFPIGISLTPTGSDGNGITRFPEAETICRWITARERLVFAIPNP